MKIIKYLIILTFITSMSLANNKTAYDFKFKDINGGELDLSQFKGKVLLVTNVASRCGFTNQYKGLQSIWEEYKNKNFVVIGVSSNDFNQELKNKEEVKKFCEVNFGINFPMTDITSVKGKNAHPFYKWVKETHGSQPKWNFYKVLISKDGNIIESFSSFTKPNSEKLIKAIEKVL
ncbi:MAG: glutathione peroxidase [Pelagibacteraceae bacterium]